MQQAFDAAIAWNWEFDADFVALVEVACRERGLRLLSIRPETLPGVLDRLRAGQLTVRLVLDRAWDIDEAFYPLVDLARRQGARVLNDRPLALRAWDKAAMHWEFISAGLHTPHTLVLPPQLEARDVPPPDLGPLSPHFIVKPAHGGGGTGVERDLTTWEQIRHIRQEHPSDKYLVQAWVTPRQTEAGPAWFRVLYALGEVYPFWWDVRTHRYRTVTRDQEARLGLDPLRTIAHSVARISRLDIFSTEIAQRADDGALVCVDYVNDPIDLRPQSIAADGVPDAAVRSIAGRIADCAAPVEQDPRGRVTSSPAGLRP